MTPRSSNPGGEAHQSTQQALPEIHAVAGHRNRLGEGPTWCGDRLLHVDILGGKVHALNPVTRERWSLPVDGGEVSAAVPRADGGIVIAIEHELISFDRDGNRETLAIVEDHLPTNRFNDCRCDRAGRLWAGTMSRERVPGTAALYCLEAGGPIRRVIAETTLSNGIGWSPDWDRMYFIDSTTQRIDVLEFDVATGGVADRRTLANVEERDGMPDGLAVDADGGVWVCLFRGGSVRRYEPDGSLSDVISLPVTDPTCPAFGGPDLRTLYITTARHRLSPKEQKREPLAGMVLSFDAGVAGMPTPRFAG